MTEKPLLDQAAALGAEGEQLLDVVERIASQARRERKRVSAEERYARLLVDVRAFLAEHPDASGTAIARELRGRKQEVLRAVREIKERFPDSRNQAA